MSGQEIAAVGSLGGLGLLGLGVLYWIRARLASGHIVIILRSKSGGELEDESAQLANRLAESERARGILQARYDDKADELDRLKAQYLEELRTALAKKDEQ